jgi:hypothetical protein
LSELFALPAKRGLLQIAKARFQPVSVWKPAKPYYRQLGIVVSKEPPQRTSIAHNLLLQFSPTDFAAAMNKSPHTMA